MRGAEGCCCGRPRDRDPPPTVTNRAEDRPAPVLVPSLLPHRRKRPPQQQLPQVQPSPVQPRSGLELMPPTSLQRRKPRSFEFPGSPKHATIIRKPRSFGNSGWLKVDLPVESPDFVCWYRRLRNVVTAGETVPSARLTAVIPGLYIGDKTDAADVGLLRRKGITHVLNCASAAETGTGEAFYSEPQTSPIRYMELAATEGDGSELLKPHMKAAAVFIDAALQLATAGSGGCLVHCVAGVNRSCCICIGFMMLRLRIPLLEATRLAALARGKILHNESFCRELVNFAQSEHCLDEPTPLASAPIVHGSRRNHRGLSELYRDHS